MRGKFKPLITVMLIIISIIAIVIVVCVYQAKYRLTDVVTYTSLDEVYAVSFQMVGEPVLPFGPTIARVKVIDKTNTINRIIEDFTVQVQDDGAALRDVNCHVEWADDSVIITLTGSEQDDDVYTIHLPD